MKKPIAVLVMFFSVTSLPEKASGSPFDELEKIASQGTLPQIAAVPQPIPQADGNTQAVQYLPPDNPAPGFSWGTGAETIAKDVHSAAGNSDFIRTGPASAPLRLHPGADALQFCALSPDTRYLTRKKPAFKGDHIIASFAGALGDCLLTEGYLHMGDVAATSAGGFWELPRTVKAFLDTIAYAEGTGAHYDYIYSFEKFEDYSRHPNRNICAGGICSTAAGRYQFLHKTWKALSADLGLQDFSPPNQEKACLELLRRARVYPAVLDSNDFTRFSYAMTRISNIWASLPGSPYGQPTHGMEELWLVYQSALAKY